MTGYVLFRFSKKTGKIDTTMTDPFGNALMQMWALQHTPKSKSTMVVDAETGEVVFAANGTLDGFPDVKRNTGKTIDEFGIPLEVVQQILKEDDRCKSMA